MSWICKDCRKYKRNKCDFLTNKNCFKPTLLYRLKKFIFG